MMSKSFQKYLDSNKSPSPQLLELLGEEHQNKKLGLSPERVEPIIPAMREYISFWREYPDLFIDFLQTGGDPTVKKGLNLYFYQRVFLRVVMRYKYVYCVFPRASKVWRQQFLFLKKGFGQTSLIMGILNSRKSEQENPE